jgi:hypothetical protein
VELVYYFMIASPGASEKVALNTTFSYSWFTSFEVPGSDSGPNQGYSTWSLGVPGANSATAQGLHSFCRPFTFDTCSNVSGSYSDTREVTNIFTNTVYYVAVQAGFGINNFNGYPGATASGAVFSDLDISLGGPLGQYQLIFSDGFGSVPDSPIGILEPGQLPLFLVALAALVTVKRRTTRAVCKQA